jgi:hypothetical protein
VAELRPSGDVRNAGGIEATRLEELGGGLDQVGPGTFFFRFT